MFLSNASIKRPVAMICLIIALTLLGLNVYRELNLEYLPKVDLPYITVVTVYPGGSPEEIETDIAKRVEDAVIAIDGLKHVTSIAMENVCQTLLEFQLEVDVDVAANDVREKLDLIVNDFPSGTEKPKVLKFDINAVPVATMALTGDVSIEELYDYADNSFRDRLTVIGGVADVQLVGGAEREVHVLLDRDKLGARNLSSLDVVQKLQEGIRTIPSGRVRDKDTEYAVKFDAEYKEVAAINELEVANQDGTRVYIKDVGVVKMTTEELRQLATVNGKPCISIRVVKKAEGNAVQVVNGVREAVEKLRPNLPGGMELIWISDDGTFIEAMVSSTAGNIIQGIILTALILFFFLYSFRSTLIVAITMPLTIIIALFFVSFLGYSLNLSTMMSTGLSIGILVTNSIVVLESIIKRLQESGNAKEAARIGSGEVAVAVAASAGTNIVVLFPIAMMGSQVGMFFKPFALTMVIMTMVSLFISFTLTPILCSLWLKPSDPKSKSPLARLERLWNRFFDAATLRFAGLLRFFEKRRWAAFLFLLGVIASFMATTQIADRVGFTFFPPEDRGEIYVKLEYPTRYNLDRTVQRVAEVEEQLKKLPEIRYMLTTIGKAEGMIGRTSEGVFIAQVLLKFSQKTERTETIEELLAKTRDLLKDHPDCIMRVSQPSGIGGQSSPIELEVAGDDLTELDKVILNIQDFANEIQGIEDPDTTVRIGKPEIRILPKRPQLADLQTPAVTLGMALRANLEGLESGIFKQGDRNYDIVVKMAEERGKEQVAEFLLPGAPGHPLLLDNVGEIEEGLAPVQIFRKNKRRISKLYAGLHNKKPMGTAIAELNNAIDSSGLLPPGYTYNYAGEYEIMQEASVEFVEAGLIALILVYLVLAAILESFKQPFIILVTIPLALIGILWALAIAGEAISMFVLLGAVMLIGIVVNNAILVMDQLNQNIKAGIPRHEAMVHAASERFRPVTMITLAAVLGMLPLALSNGIGSENRVGIGVASVGGIAVSALLTLLVMPILYDLFTRRAKKDTK